MKILFISATYLPTVNGVSYYQLHLSQALRRLGHQVYIYAPAHPQAVYDPFVIRYPAILTPFAHNYPLGLPLLNLHLLDSLPLDIVHIHHPFTIAQCALKLKHERHLPFIFTHHTQYHQYLTTYFPYFANPTGQLINRHLLAVAKEASKVICPTPLIHQQFQSMGVLNSLVISNGIDLSQIHPAHHQPGSTLKLIHVGRLEKEKNPLPLIDLAASLKQHSPNFHLTIVGTGKLLPRLKSLSVSRHLNSSLTFTGHLDQSAIRELLYQQHFFVSFSHTEVMPLAYIEALSCGVPLALTLDGLIPGLSTAKNSLTLSDHPPSAAAQIIKVFQHPASLTALSLAAAHSAQKFDINYCARQILKVYRQSVTQPKTS